MPPAALTWSIQSLKPLFWRVDSTLRLPVREAVKPTRIVFLPAGACVGASVGAVPCVAASVAGGPIGTFVAAGLGVPGVQADRIIPNTPSAARILNREAFMVATSNGELSWTLEWNRSIP